MPKVIDRVNAGIARFWASSAGQRKVDLAFVKAVNHDDCPPKEKHVKTLLRASEIRNWSSQDYLVQHIEKTILNEESSLVILKTLILLHRILLEGGDMFREVFYKSFSHLFDHLSNFRDSSNAFSLQISTFVRAYAAFLHQRLMTYSSFPYESESSRPHYLTIEQLIEELPFLHKGMDLGLQCVTSSDLSAMTLGTLQGEAQHLVLRDVLVFSYHIMKCISRLVDLFFEQIHKDNVQQGKSLLYLYVESQKLVDDFSNLDVDRFGDKWGALDLQRPPDSVVNSMSGHISDLSNSICHLTLEEDTFADVDLLC